MFTLAHLSDPHLSPIEPPRLVEIGNKRGLGLINWHRGRKNVHRAEILDAVIGDLKSSPVDHIAVTGDLVNLSLSTEFRRARAWLEKLGAPQNVTLIPGNHDAYVAGARDWAADYWGEYMTGDDGANRAHFPFLRRRGNMALIALSTSLPTGPLLATGRLGDEQISRLAQMLDQNAALFRIVLIHHPPISPLRRYLRRLTDAEKFRRVLHEKGADLVLHGHDHRHSLIRLDGPRGKKIPVAGVQSASARAHGTEDAGGYNLFRIDGDANAWRCEMISRQYQTDGSVREIGRQTLY